MFSICSPWKKGKCDKKPLQIMCGIQIAVKYCARAHLPTANRPTFLHSLEAKESSGPLKAMNSACVRVRVCWISEGVLICVSHRHTRQLCPAHWNTWRVALHKASKHIQCKHAQLTLLLSLYFWAFFLAVCSTFACFFSRLETQWAYLKMLSVFVLCHLFCSNVLIIKSWWCKTTDTVIWILVTSCLPSASVLCFLFHCDKEILEQGRLFIEAPGATCSNQS